MTNEDELTDRRDNSRTIRARRGSEIVAKSWATEAAVRMLMNNLDDEVAEDPQSLVVYGGIGRAARNWACYDKIVETLERLERRRNLADPVGQAGRRVPHPQGRAARAPRQLQPRPQMGDLGDVQRARSRRADDVRPDDRRQLDLHRHPGHRPRHVRNLRRNGPPALWRRPHGQMDPDRRPRRDGRRAAARRGHGRGALHRGRSARKAGSRSASKPATSTAARPASTRRSTIIAEATEPTSRRPARQRRRNPPRNGRARHPPRRGHRPDQRARPRQRLLPGRLERRQMAGDARARPASRRRRRAPVDGRATSKRCSPSRRWASRPSIMATTSARKPRTRASPTRSTSPASSPPTSGPCSAAASARSAGSLCRAIPRTSTRPTSG